MIDRNLKLGLTDKETIFLWGPRQTGKSTLLKNLFPKARYYDLLRSDIYNSLIMNPGIIREECDAVNLKGENQEFPIIIDEVQKIPSILDEVHWLIENRGLRFILCGSSARKLKRNQANLLGGRAVRYELFPFVYSEINNFNLLKALNHGLIPRHYLSKYANRLIRSYIGDFLKEEVAAESLIRNLPAFSRFLTVSAHANGELINFNNIASECSVSAPTVKEYYNIVIDTLLGRYISAFRKKSKRRQILAPKFYYFDVGVTAHMENRGPVLPGSDIFGKAFEHFIVNEVIAYSHYSEKFFETTFWRSASGFEVDLVLGDCLVAIEIKSSQEVKSRHLKGIRAFNEEYITGKSLIVSLDKKLRKAEDGIEIFPWQIFLECLWNGQII